MYPLAVILFPVLWALSQQRQASVLPIPACTVLGLQMLIRRTGDFAGTLLDTIVLDAIPGPEYLAMANSVTFSMAAVGRAIGPFIVSGFFSFATTSTSALSPRRQLVWLVFMLVCTPSIYFGERVVFDIVGPEAHAKGEWDEEHELLTPLSEDRPFHNDD
jgi:hypothetical protein